MEKNRWEHLRLDLISKGLDLTRSIEDVTFDFLTRSTNVQHTQEGSIVQRGGTTAVGAPANFYDITLPAWVDSVVTVPLTAASTVSYRRVVGVGAFVWVETATPNVFAQFAIPDHWFNATAKKSMVVYQTPYTLDPWVYISDGLIGRKVKPNSGSGVINRMGISAPFCVNYRNDAIPPPVLSDVAATSTVIDDGVHSTGSTWYGTECTPSGTSTNITIAKPSRPTADPGALADCQTFVNTVAGTGDCVASVAFAATNLATNYNDNSPIELFFSISNGTEIDRIELRLSAYPLITSNISNTSPIVVTTTTNHGLTTGDQITLNGSTSTGANGNWTITVTGSTTFQLNGSTAGGLDTGNRNVAVFSNHYYSLFVYPTDEQTQTNEEFDAIPKKTVEDFYGLAEQRMRMDGFALYLKNELGLTQGSSEWVQLWNDEREVRAEQLYSEYLDTELPQTKSFGVNAWVAISRDREGWIRVGDSLDFNWATIAGARIIARRTADATTLTKFRFYQWDIVKSGSVLNSTETGTPYDWRYTYYNQSLGIESNPSPQMPEGVYVNGQIVTIQMRGTADSQVSHLRLYRRGGVLSNYHMVAQIANTGDSIHSTDDIADDLTASGSRVLDFDNDQPCTVSVVRTNWLKYSCNFEPSTTDWNYGGTGTEASISVNNGVAPDGGQTADKFVAITNSCGTDYITQSISGLTQDDYYDFSVYMKVVKEQTATPSQVYVSLGVDTGSGWGWTGAALNSPSTNRHPGVWERIVVRGRDTDKFKAGATNSIAIRIDNSQAGAEVLLWGAQVTEAAYQTWDGIEINRATPFIYTGNATAQSYVPTYGVRPKKIFGPFLGKYIFGVNPQLITYPGSVVTYNPVYSGDLFWCKPGNPDAWPSVNRVRVTSGGDPLVNGCIHSGRAFVFTKKGLHAVNVNPISENIQIITSPTPCNEGLWDEDALCVGDRIYFLGRNGIYATDGGPAINLTRNSMIRPLFEGTAVNGYNPVKWDGDFCLEWVDPYLLFIYQDSGSAYRMLLYHTQLDRWEFHTFAYPPRYAYWDKLKGELLMNYYNATGPVYGLQIWGSGATDLGTAYSCNFRTGSTDLGVAEQKLFGDVVVDGKVAANSVTCQVYLDDEVVTSSGGPIANTTRDLTYVPINTGEGKEGHSLALDFSWLSYDNTVATTPALYGADISFRPKERVRTLLTTDWEDLGIPHDKYLWGVALDIDTFNNAKEFYIQVDGVNINDPDTAQPYWVVTANGRQVVELSWPPVRGAQVRILPKTTHEFELYGLNWTFLDEEKDIKKWAIQWQSDYPLEDMYCWGVELECDTKNLAKTIKVEKDGGTLIGNYSVTANGHDKVRITWNAQKCRTIRITSTDVNPGYLYAWKFYADAEAPNIPEWDTNWEGDLTDKWLSGIYLDIDTNNLSKDFNLYFDGTAWAGNPQTVVANGRKMVKIGLGQRVQCVKMRMEAADTNNNPCRLYEWRWIYEPEPVELVNAATNWTNLEWPYEKLVKGFAIEADTEGQNVTLTVRKNGDETTTPTDIAGTTIATQVINFAGRGSDEFNILTVGGVPTMLRGHTFMIDANGTTPLDNKFRIYNVQWIFDREPPCLHQWRTQEHAFNVKDYVFLVDAQICVRTTAANAITLAVTHDGTTNNYTIAHTSGNRRKVRVPFNPVKGKVFQFSLTSTTPFYVYNEDTNIVVRPFRGGDEQTYQLPFEGGTANP